MIIPISVSVLSILFYVVLSLYSNYKETKRHEKWIMFEIEQENNYRKNEQYFADIHFEMYVKLQARRWHSEWYKGSDCFLIDPEFSVYKYVHESAKYKDADFKILVYTELDRLKKQSGPRPETKMDQFLKEHNS